MEDDEETQSPPSGSPAQPRPNGRITVTVAASAPPPNTLTLALPIQQPRNAASSGGGREDCWSEGATAVLIDAWGERYLELSRGNLKQQHWKDVADVVAGREGHTNSKTPKTDVQCKNRIDTVKKKYKTEKAKIAAGGGPSKWRFYDRLDELIGPTAAAAMTNQKKIPIGIQLGLRSSSLHNKFQPNHQKHQNQKIQQSRKRGALTESESSDPETSPEESTDSLPPPATLERKRPRRVPRIEEERERNWGKSLRELTKAIVRFGEAYEQAESSKIEQLVELEKQRMKFTKEVELQRMQFFMKTQLEISQLKHNTPPPRKRRAGNTNNHHSNSNSNSNNNINNNSDSSG